MVSACLFDLDGTLLDREQSLHAFLTRQYARHILIQNRIPLKTFITRFHELDQRGYVWKDVVYQTIVEEFKLEGLTSDELLKEYIQLFSQDCVAFSGVVDTLQTLHRTGMRLGIITNGRTAFQMQNLRAIGIEPYVQTILISEEEGVSKPSSIIFERALKKLEVNASEAVYVGDHPVNDIQGARKAGMKTVWKRDEYWQEPVEAEAVIDHIPDLLAILDGW